MTKKGWKDPLFSSLLSGLLLILAHEPFGFGWLALFLAIPLLRQFSRGWKIRFLCGWLAGFLLQAVGYSWIFLTVHDFSGQTPLLSAAAATLFWLYQSLDVAFWMLLAPMICRRLPEWARPFAAAACWLLVQDHLFPAVFPWSLANAFATFPPLAGTTAFWGIAGLGFFALSLQGLAVWYRGRQRTFAVSLCVLLLMGGHLARFRGETETWRIGVVQPCLIEWAKTGTERPNAGDFFDAHFRPSLTLLDKDLDLLVWPETSLPFDLDRFPNYRKRIENLCRELDAAMVIGVMEYTDKKRFTNSVVMLTPDGAEPQFYRKEKLVYFSEYLPDFMLWLRKFDPALGGFQAGKDNQPFSYRGRQFVPLVCFEALFPDYVRRRSGHLMLNLTNDSWFGKSPASSQHLQQIRLRTLETGMPLLRATNSGISCWVDHNGNIRDPGGLFVPETHIYEVDLPVKAPVAYSFWGAGLVRVFGAVLIAWSLFGIARRKKPSPDG